MTAPAARNTLAKVIWHASRADEGTISATGANIVADAILASGVVVGAAELADSLCPLDAGRPHECSTLIAAHDLPRVAALIAREA